MKNQNARIIFFIIFLILSISAAILLILYTFGIGNDYHVSYELGGNRWTIHWMLLEYAIIALGTVVSNLLLWKWVKRPNKVILALSLMLITYVVSLILTFLKKIWWFYFVGVPIDETSYVGGLIYNYRFTLILAAIAAWLFYYFYLQMYTERSKVSLFFKILVNSITLIAVGMQFYTFAGQSSWVQMAVSGVVLIQSLVILIPIFVTSVKLIKTISRKQEAEIYIGILFLVIIALNYILILLSYVLSIVYDTLTNTVSGPFYVAQQVLTITMIINCYIGFVFPKWFKKLVIKK